MLSAMLPSRLNPNDRRSLMMVFLAGPLVWAIYFLVGYFLIETVCSLGGLGFSILGLSARAWAIVLLTVIAASVTAYAGVRAYRYWRQLSPEDRVTPTVYDAEPARSSMTSNSTAPTSARQDGRARVISGGVYREEALRRVRYEAADGLISFIWNTVVSALAVIVLTPVAAVVTAYGVVRRSGDQRQIPRKKDGAPLDTRVKVWTQETESEHAGELFDPEGRSRFMALAAVQLNVLFTLVNVMTGAAALFLQVC